MMNVNGDRSGHSTVLHVREKESAYLRMIVCGPDDHVFVEKYIGWDGWSAYKRELDNLKVQVDRDFQDGCPDRAGQDALRLGAVLEDLLRKIGVDPVGNSPLDIYYGKNTPLLPFEALFPRRPVSNHLPGKKGPSRQEPFFTLVYTESLEHTGREIEVLRSALKGRGDLEIYSERQFSDSCPELKSGYFHFAGHGLVRDGKSELDLGSRFRDPLIFSRDMELAFLNCCFTGSVAEGVLSGLFERGTRHAIASPYNIPDGFLTDAVADFYGNCGDREPGRNFFLTALKYPAFGLFYRHFRCY
jgi:hypothetical protein